MCHTKIFFEHHPQEIDSHQFDVVAPESLEIHLFPFRMQFDHHKALCVAIDDIIEAFL